MIMIIIIISMMLQFVMVIIVICVLNWAQKSSYPILPDNQGFKT